MKPEKAIKRAAKNNGVSEQHVRDEMQKALDAAWNSSDEEALKRQRELFPDGKPTLEEFIRKVAQTASGS